MPEVWNATTQVITADGVVGTLGAATRVFNIHVLTSGITAAVISLRNGTVVTDTIYIKETGTASAGKTIDYGMKGHLFPAGCFCDVDANTTSVTVNYSQ